MGIIKAKAATPPLKERPSVAIEVSGEKCRFREPRTSDFTPPQQLVDRLTADYPTLEGGRIRVICILVACYLPDKDEQNADIAQAFADVARDNDYAFEALSTEFFEAYPEFTNWVKAKAQAKND